MRGSEHTLVLGSGRGSAMRDDLMATPTSQKMAAQPVDMTKENQATMDTIGLVS